MIEAIECEQGSPEWYEARLGLVTASEFSTVMAKGVGGKGDSKGRRTYMLKLIGEKMTGEVQEGYTNGHMERGKIMEAEARDYYAFVQDVSPARVGFIKRGRVGCSPDSLIDTAGLLEVKTRLPHLQLELILADRVPPEHLAQIHGQLWVAEREWCDFVSYWPKMPAFIKRVYRDDAYIKTIETAVNEFLSEMDELTERLRTAQERGNLGANQGCSISTTISARSCTGSV